MASIKVVAESPNLLGSIPSDYAYSTTHFTPIASDQEHSIPVIDYSLLTSGVPGQRSKVIDDLGKACEEWGCFLLVNHGVPETLIDKVFDASNEFFNLSEEEKQNFGGKNALDPIRCGTSFRSASMGKILLWRDYLKVIAHPEFHFPDKPAGFSELSFQYCKRTRIMARELLKGITKNLGLEESDMDNALNLDSGLQQFAVNIYPPCPQPELAIGIPPHTDHGLVTLLIQNGVKGLELQHNGKWVNVDGPPNSFIVDIGDHLEIFSNGKYKSVEHRAVVNSKTTRISLATNYGPSLDIIVRPALKLVDTETNPAAYIPMEYKEYLEKHLGPKSLDFVRVQGR